MADSQVFLKRRIHLLTTGGTIEKTYDESDGSLSNRGSFVLDQIHHKLRLPHTEILHTDLLCKDSLDMTDEDRQVLLQAILSKLPERLPILILHGTDTMILSASYVKHSIPAPKVPILFTGAMIPLGFENSDAMQNVTEALALSFTLEPQVGIVFHSQLFDPLQTKKDRARKTFQRL